MAAIIITNTTSTKLHNYEVRTGRAVVKCHNLATAIYYRNRLRTTNPNQLEELS